MEEIVRTCNMHGGKDKCIQNFGRKLEGRDKWESLGLVGKIILSLA
jgi:hypothetical protein